MKDALIQLSKGVQKGPAADLVPVLFGEKPPMFLNKSTQFTLFNKSLDHSQVTFFFQIQPSMPAHFKIFFPLDLRGLSTTS